ncbi:PREDICTED: 45 kDa calcium-binding protein isoform X1 [Nicrophorus vespilloides]|uniref:45 kDa calcium-binding protein isoform X1 n=1 Tax=Nicrophorus vespilloides TaxID=110193 RepID=A0ABM1ND80_NICVS|nr:PREDICTED: 45 kDa calcium-binding protein isoform X1 [Nicrophorus vespilloides]
MNKSSLTICHRWSFTVPILCYILFFIMIWTLSVPLKPNIRIEIPNDTPMELKRGVEDTFEIRMKNSNFNSDKNAEDNLLNEKNEYLINVNNKENINKDQTEILEDVFKKADKNKNGKLDTRELSEWIRMKIIEHITSAVSNNYGLFSLIDRNPKNGVVSWKEYHSYFLKKRGFSKKYVKNHDEKRHKGLERSLKEQIMRDKASWMEAARTNPDTLTVDEFLTFTHPESSATNQLALVDDLYDKFDRDGDELLTEDEFAILQTEGEEETVIVRQDEKERRSEFRKSIDLNGDGKADRRELLHYVAPQSPRHSEHEAEALLALADNDQDNMISLDEILAHPNLFLKSKMVDTARSFHDEF